MDRADDQVACVGCLERYFKGFQIPHFAQNNDIRRLSEHMSDAFNKRRGVTADLPLVDIAFPMGVQEFHRVFKGDNITATAGVDMVNHGAECRTFAVSGRAGHQNQTLWFHTEFFQPFGQIEGLKRGQRIENRPQCNGDGISLTIDVHPKASYFRIGHTDVKVIFF